jgi:hypothetical protein
MTKKVGSDETFCKPGKFHLTPFFRFSAFLFGPNEPALQHFHANFHAAPNLPALKAIPSLKTANERIRVPARDTVSLGSRSFGEYFAALKLLHRIP